MPKAGITVEECVITEWLKKPGDDVAVGDVLFTYETDKASFECESTAAGTLLEIFYEEGDEVPVLVNVCAVGTPGEDVSALRSGKGALDAGNGADEGTHRPDTPEDLTPADALGAAVRTDDKSAPAGSVSEESASTLRSDIKISPRAKMTAQALGVDATAASPSGPYGRIIERDVRTFAQGAGLSPSEAPQREVSGVSGASLDTSFGNAKDKRQAPSSEAAEYVDEKFSPIRKATARAMLQSLSTMAQLTHQHSFDAGAVLNLRKQIKEHGEEMGLANITVNDIVMFAVSRVILNHPDLNATMQEENVIRKFRNVHLGMAVDTPKGLMVPTLFNANKMSLSEMSVEAKRLTSLCRESKATPDMLSGATFTVSNVGSLGVEVFTPVINPPQVAILGVCGVTTRIREVNGQITTYPAMNLCLTYDHRAIDGTPASKFLKELCTALENFPLIMMK